MTATPSPPPTFTRRRQPPRRKDATRRVAFQQPVAALLDSLPATHQSRFLGTRSTADADVVFGDGDAARRAAVLGVLAATLIVVGGGKPPRHQRPETYSSTSVNLCEPLHPPCVRALDPQPSTHNPQPWTRVPILHIPSDHTSRNPRPSRNNPEALFHLNPNSSTLQL